MLLDILANSLISTIGFTKSLADKLKIRYVIFLFFLVVFLTYLTLGTPYPAIIIVPLIIFYIIVFTKNKAINGIAALIGYIASAMCNNLMIVLVQKVFNMDAQTLLSTKKALVIFYICFLIVVYLISSLIGKLFRRFVTKSDFAKSPSTLVLIFVELLLCATILVFNITYARQLGYPQNTIVFNCVLFFVYFVLSSLLLINIVSSTKKNLQMQQELDAAKQLQEYTETIEYHASQMREFKHDYLNILLTLDELIHESDNKKLITYFDEQIKPTGDEVQTINTGLVALKHIGDTAVKSLIYTKLSFALSKGIELHLFLNFDIPEFPMKSMDLAKLLGIYLDNAIEAALTAEKPEISIVFTKTNGISLEIANNYNGEKPCLSRLTEKGYSLKGENRGLGLAQAEQILDQYPQIIHTVEVRETSFIQTVNF